MTFDPERVDPGGDDDQTRRLRKLIEQFSVPQQDLRTVLSEATRLHTGTLKVAGMSYPDALAAALGMYEAGLIPRTPNQSDLGLLDDDTPEEADHRATVAEAAKVSAAHVHELATKAADRLKQGLGGAATNPDRPIDEHIHVPTPEEVEDLYY